MASNSPAPMWTKEGRQDWNAWYRYMREHHPLAYHEEIGAYGAFRYEDVRAIFSDNESWSVERRYDRLPEDQRGLHITANTVNGLDPPKHNRVRLLAMPAFAPNRMAALEARVREISAQLLDALLPRGEFDFANEYAHPFPQMVVNEILGIPPEDFAKAKDLGDRMEAATGRFTGSPMTNVEDLRAVHREYRAYFDPIIEARRHHDHGDVMSKLVQAEQEGDRLTPEELFKMAMIIIRGGGETTMAGITHMLRLMMEHPDQYERLKADPGLIPTAVEEVLRFYPPSHSMARVATRDVEMGGMTIPEGATMLMWLPAANRDPEAFPDPDRFDVGRKPNRHVSLGYGIHLCIGMSLARLEMRVALEQWMERVESFRRAETGPIDWTQVSLVAVFPRRLPVAVKSYADAASQPEAYA